ncbi:hypothetical protein [Singulisphaera acidiphila]|uniref:hypothetical protein n=1 Tax=Singulisphaera acidiphila TaxID=466153 RepID=UPI0012B60B3F|nr:hypothetical protein [Singulisphaera acidiphila]
MIVTIAFNALNFIGLGIRDEAEVPLRSTLEQGQRIDKPVRGCFPEDFDGTTWELGHEILKLAFDIKVRENDRLPIAVHSHAIVPHETGEGRLLDLRKFRVAVADEDHPELPTT